MSASHPTATRRAKHIIQVTRGYMTIAETMRAIAISAPGGPDVLQEVQVPVPVPGPGDVLIEVAAAGVNRPDVLQRKGL